MAYPTMKPEEALEPTWEIAQLFPAQGHWSEEEYLTLDTNHLIEFSHGQLEILPMPTQSHQLLVIALFELLRNFVRERDLGTVLFAPMRVQLWPGKFREPDIVFMAAEHADRLGEQFWRGADLVMEIVSPDVCADARRKTATIHEEHEENTKNCKKEKGRAEASNTERDKVTKRREYAQAGIPEYWIVDPVDSSISVLTLHGSDYTLHGKFVSGETASSLLLDRFTVEVSAVFSEIS